MASQTLPISTVNEIISNLLNFLPFSALGNCPNGNPLPTYGNFTFYSPDFAVWTITNQDFWGALTACQAGPTRLMSGLVQADLDRFFAHQLTCTLCYLLFRRS